MSPRVRYATSVVCLALSIASGCAPSRPIFLNSDHDLSHYRALATEFETPLVESPRLGEVTNSLPPLTLSNPEAKEIWDLTLQEAVKTALSNNKTLKVLNSFQTSGLSGAGVSSSAGTDRLFNAGAAEGGGLTIYDPALIESDPRFGVEAALSAFDATLSSSMFWEKNDRPLNFFITGFQQAVFQQDLGTQTTELQKRIVSGGIMTVRNHNNYELNNNQQNLFSNVYNSDIEAEFRHPLLQGAGVQFNRIAGPGGIPGFYNGVVIARIATDIQLVQFEEQVRNMVMDIEKAYWTLYNNYRRLDANLAGRDSALQTWRTVRAKYAQVPGGEADKEAQSRQQYYQFRALVEQTLKDLYASESALRYLMGLAPTDGRLIRPADEPTTARVNFDWHDSLSESLVRTAELREQKWRVKEAELRLIASKNYLLPNLDFAARYRWRGMGEQLVDSVRGDTTSKEILPQFNAQGVQTSPGRLPQTTPFNSAYQTLTHGDFQEWQLGFEARIPLGFRRQLAGVRNEELRLARRRAILQEEELLIAHYLSSAIRELDSTYKLAETNFNRRVAAQREVDAATEKYQAGTVTLDQVLDAQRRLADSEQAYFNALVDYNTQIAMVHYRKGSLLEYNGVHLAEGPWTEKAYRDALKRAQERDAGLFIDYGFTRPNVISGGPYEQFQGGMYNQSRDGQPTLAPEAAPIDAPIETIPPGKPTPAAPGQSVDDAVGFDPLNRLTAPDVAERAVYASRIDRRQPNIDALNSDSQVMPTAWTARDATRR